MSDYTAVSKNRKIQLQNGMSSSEATFYVNTHEIVDAAAGAEVQLLKKIGIEPPASGHIDCPYPRHGGTSDWRWDFKLAKAFCTCAKGDSIFDVVMKCTGTDFSGAKKAVAEMLGRNDLIRRYEQRGSGTKSDAQSLLNPPADRRDDSLVRGYLAFRLGVDPVHVILPETGAVGWTTLPYFDAPTVQDGKPELVGSYSCTVWPMVDRDGGVHALRIFVAAQGRGKANLPPLPDGRRRDCKKSARRKEGDNISGRAVLWGKTDAPWTILCEGIETGAAIAASFRDEVLGGQALIAAAGSANGVESYRPWPSCVRVTVAADRDEKRKPDGSPGSQRGLRAAENFAARKRVAGILVALPGEPETSVDWLDIFVSHGREAVRKGILAGAPVEVPDHLTQRAGVVDLLEEYERRYPIPKLYGTLLRYSKTPDGRVAVHKEVQGKKDGEVFFVPIASPFGVPARLRYHDSNNAFGLRVIVEAMDGESRSVDIGRELLASSRCNDVLSQLYSAGMRLEGDGERLVLGCLRAADPCNEIAVVKRPGWHQVDGVLTYLCPDGESIGGAEGQTVELASHARLPRSVATAGTLDAWKSAVAAAISNDGCEHWSLGILAGFAGVLVSLAGADTCGVNLSGLTSAGKSTAQRLAASVWSTPSATVDGLYQSAKSTINGLESSAARATGSVFVLDELGHVSGRELGKIIYMIAGGVGKRRMAADACPRQNYNWSTFALLSAERSLAEIIRADGGEITAGMALRIVDIDVTDVNRTVSTATLQAIDAISTNYGHAGPEFVRFLGSHDFFARPDAVRRHIVRTAASIAGDDVDSAMKRAALPFAILRIAGLTAREARLLPEDMDIAGVIDWAWRRFRGSAEAETLDAGASAIANLHRWLAERWGSTVQDPRVQSNRDAQGWFDANHVYIPAERLSAAAGGTLKEREIAKILDRAGFISKRKDADCRYVAFVPGIGKVKAYALTRKEFGRAEGLTAADIPF